MRGRPEECRPAWAPDTLGSWVEAKSASFGQHLSRPNGRGREARRQVRTSGHGDTRPEPRSAHHSGSPSPRGMGSWERSRGRGDRLGKGARERGAVMGQPGPAKCPTSVSRLEVRRRWRLARHGDGSDRGTAGPPGPALVAWQRQT